MSRVTGADWLRTSMRERAGWWRLPPDQFRVAMWLVAVAEVHDDEPRFVATADELARFFRVSRQKIKRTLGALEKSGFVRLWARRGRGGVTQIVIRDVRPFGLHSSPDLLQAGTTEESAYLPGYEPSVVGHLPGHSVTEPTSGCDPGPKIKCPDIYPAILESSQVPETTDPSDLDLQRSLLPDPDLRSDLRSTTSRNITVSGLEGAAIWAEELPDQTPGEPAPRVNVGTIPDRAFAAADYLRAAILREQPSALIGTAPWDQAVKSGRRLTWADEFRLLHAAVLAAMRHESAETTEDSAWSEIARTVYWVFHGQPAGYRFEVESPTSLRKKWDRIRSARTQQARKAAQPAPARGSDGREDPQANRQFKRLGDQ